MTLEEGNYWKLIFKTETHIEKNCKKWLSTASKGKQRVPKISETNGGWDNDVKKFLA